MVVDARIFVFRTNVRTRREATLLCNQLHLSGLASRATVDLEDCDRVLRVETDVAEIAEIERLVRGLNIQIEELN